MSDFLLIVIAIIAVIKLVSQAYVIRALLEGQKQTNKTLKSMVNNVNIEPFTAYAKNDTVMTQKLYEQTISALRKYNPNRTTVSGETKEFTPVVVEDRSSAEEVLTSLRSVLEKYDVAMLVDLYDLVGLASVFEDSRWGWNDLSDAKIQETEHGWEIILPKMLLRIDLINEAKKNVNVGFDRGKNKINLTADEINRLNAGKKEENDLNS